MLLLYSHMVSYDEIKHFQGGVKLVLILNQDYKDNTKTMARLTSSKPNNLWLKKKQQTLELVVAPHISSVAVATEH